MSIRSQDSNRFAERLRRSKAESASLLVLEEVDALEPVRGPMTRDHKVEEVVELLWMDESASQNGVLFIATTNRKHALDPALLRRCRFDHAIEVGYPSAEEVRAALQEILSERPRSPKRKPCQAPHEHIASTEASAIRQRWGSDVIPKPDSAGCISRGVKSSGSRLHCVGSPESPNAPPSGPTCGHKA